MPYIHTNSRDGRRSAAASESHNLLHILARARPVHAPPRRSRSKSGSDHNETTTKKEEAAAKEEEEEEEEEEEQVMARTQN